MTTRKFLIIFGEQISFLVGQIPLNICRFGKIIFINSDTEKVHLQWLSHGSATHLEDIYDPQELFLTDLCDSVDLADIANPIVVYRCSTLPVPTFPHGEFFFKCVPSINLVPSFLMGNLLGLFTTSLLAHTNTSTTPAAKLKPVLRRMSPPTTVLCVFFLKSRIRKLFLMQWSLVSQ
jgi:hypothetical protein